MRGAAASTKEGIPSIVLVSPKFAGVAENVYKGMGFGKLPLAVIPQEVFVGIEKDILPSVSKVVDTVVSSLKEAASARRSVPIGSEPKMLRITAPSYQEASDRMNRLFLERGWGDGLPLVMPTEQRVSWLLEGTDLDPRYEIGRIPSRMGAATVEMVAVHAAMAGARPEHMPVIIAAVEALAEPSFGLETVQGSTNPSTPMVVVNGPVAKELKINSGFGCLGPHPEFPAGAVIGRTTRLIMTVLGGSVPGRGSMVMHGQPGRFTNLVFAEAEEETPWEPLHVELGCDRNVSTVSVFTIASTINISCLHDVSNVSTYVGKAARYVALPHQNYFPFNDKPLGPAGFLLIPPLAAQGLAHAGWSKRKIKEFLYENARIPLGELNYYMEGSGEDVAKLIAMRGPWLKQYSGMSADTRVPVAWGPDAFMVIVCGGGLAFHWQWLPVGTCSTPLATKQVKLPALWGRLLQDS